MKGLSESQIQRQILDYLAAKGVLAFRMNSGLQIATYGGKKRAIRYGVPGMADVLAFIRCGYHRSCDISQWVLWIECKAEKGKQSELQKSFQKQVEEHGHRYAVCRSVEDVEELLK